MINHPRHTKTVTMMPEQCCREQCFEEVSRFHNERGPERHTTHEPQSDRPASTKTPADRGSCVGGWLERQAATSARCASPTAKSLVPQECLMSSCAFRGFSRL